MEDRSCFFPSLRHDAYPGGLTLLAIFDGHGGTLVADYCSNNIANHIKNIKDPMNPQGLQDMFLRMDLELFQYAEGKSMIETMTTVTKTETTSANATIEHPTSVDAVLPDSPGIFYPTATYSNVALHCGSTACIVVVDSMNYKMAVAHIGDTRALLIHPNNRFSSHASLMRWYSTGSKSKAMYMPLTMDHKPSNDREKQRIEKAGNTVDDASNRIGIGGVNMSRAFGDFFYKQNKLLPADEQQLIAIPEVNVVPFELGDMVTKHVKNF